MPKMRGASLKLIRHLLLTTTACVSLAILANERVFADEAKGEPVKIGVIVDRSGIVFDLSRGQTDALKAGADAINKGQFFWGAPPATSGKPGILGRPIELLQEDAQADANQALSKAKRLASSGAQAIIITTTSPEMMQARLVCAEVKIICIGPAVASAAIVTPPNNEFAFTLAPNFLLQGQALANSLKAAQYKTVAIIRDESAASKAASESHKANFAPAGIKIVAEESVPAGAREITGQLLRIRESKPDAVLNLVAPPVENALFMRAYQDSKIGAPQFSMGALISQPEAWKLAGSAVDGTVAVDYLSPVNPDVKPFVDYFRSIYGKERHVLSTNVMPVTALLLIKRAMEDAGSTSGDQVKAALEKVTKFPAGFGQRGYTVNFSPENHNGATPASIVIVEFAGQAPSKEWARYQPAQ